jgi:CheY-like chemotaxis protein
MKHYNALLLFTIFSQRSLPNSRQTHQVEVTIGTEKYDLSGLADAARGMFRHCMNRISVLQDKDAADTTPGGGRMNDVKELSSALLLSAGKGRRANRQLEQAHIFANPVLEQQQEKSKKRPRILIVEDDPSLAHLIASYLTAHEFAVEIASTGELAVTMLNDYIPDLVVLDLELSGSLSGWDVLQSLRREVMIPVILTTSMTLSVRRYLRSSSETRLTLDHLPKPYPVQALLRRIKRMLSLTPS